MSLKNILNKFKFYSKKPEKVNSDNSYCYSKIIWNSSENLIMLLSFTEDYFGDIIELQDAINNIAALNSKIVYSSYDEETTKEDEDGNTTNIMIIHKKHYLLIGGHPKDFSYIYKYINNLGNNVLSKISDEIVNNCIADDFKYLIDDGILSFKNADDVDLNTPKTINSSSNWTELCECDDAEAILKQLPDGITGKDILKLISIRAYDKEYGDDYKTSYCNLYDFIYDIMNMAEDQFKSSIYYEVYSSVINNPTVKKLKMIYEEPLYKQPDDDAIPGDVSDESLDEIFREHYERFSAVADNTTQYEDIDEELADDEESENMKEGDRIE